MVGPTKNFILQSADQTGKKDEKVRISSFNLEKALQAIPALRPEEFQRRIQASRQRGNSSTLSPSLRQGGDSSTSTAADLPPAMVAKRSKAPRQPPGATATAQPEAGLVVTSQGH